MLDAHAGIRPYQLTMGLIVCSQVTEELELMKKVSLLMKTESIIKPLLSSISVFAGCPQFCVHCCGHMAASLLQGDELVPHVKNKS